MHVIKHTEISKHIHLRLHGFRTSKTGYLWIFTETIEILQKQLKKGNLQVKSQ